MFWYLEHRGALSSRQRIVLQHIKWYTGMQIMMGVYLFEFPGKYSRLTMLDLRSDIKELKGIGPKRAAAFHRIGVHTVYDLLACYPKRYENGAVQGNIASLKPNEDAMLVGTIEGMEERRIRAKLSLLTLYVADESGKIAVSCFNQPFLKRRLRIGKRVCIAGKTSYAYGGRGQLVIKQPRGCFLLEDASASKEIESFSKIQPVYFLTEALTQTIFRAAVKEALTEVSLTDILSDGIRQRNGLLRRQEAFRAIHFPKDDTEQRLARKTLAFEELYLIQCGLFYMKKKNTQLRSGISFYRKGDMVESYRKTLPFALTGDQERTWLDIEKDMSGDRPMRRLVQGDVGSGKTVLAAMALLKAVENSYQGALMAPTEILARQHYEGLVKAFQPFRVRVAFLSGQLTQNQKKAVLVSLADHSVDIVIGTHALLQDGVNYAKLGLVITDEQHRFGVQQRAALESKADLLPDVLVMTATPIPRTMMLTIYGDLDISTIREMPPGRTPIRTFLRRFDRRTLIYKYVKDCILQGGQAYVVCPLVEANEARDLSSAEEVYDELRSGVFYGLPCGLLHGKMGKQEKAAVMEDFHAGKIKLLVATTVIEVGVNVPNASIMVIEHAECFGLSQLHQLRGRVGRGSRHSDCIMIAAAKSEQAITRLELMTQIQDGFQLAEEDMRLRGPGAFFSDRQHGLPDLKIADVFLDMGLLLKAREEAQKEIGKGESKKHILPLLAMMYQKQFSHILDT